MKYFKQIFTIHPVGQGLFYSGLVELEFNPNNVKSYRFVFDCGSMNRSNCLDEVEEYRRVDLLNGTQLDLLVISHFDQDHVNHIHKLLESRKVKNVIAPFLNFEERLFLLLRVFNQAVLPESGPDLNFLISFIIDPVGTINPYLDDEEGQVLLINSDPELPIFPLVEGEQSSGEFNPDANWVLNLNGNDKILSSNEKALFLLSRHDKTKIILDSIKPVLKLNFVEVMEFLFYRKSIGVAEDKFYKKVYELFIQKFKTKFSDPKIPTIDEIVQVFKSIKGATIVKNIFSAAKKNFPSLKVSESDLRNMNTTALCLLHRNLPSFYKYFNADINTITRIENECEEIKKIKLSSGISSISTHLEYYLNYDFHYIERRIFPYAKFFPNTLLTSDTFLLKDPDVSAFLNRYWNYWNNYWIFQVPHHGSSNNSNITLLSNISSSSHLFVNYGVKKEWPGKWRHPSPGVINDIVASGHSCRLIPVNETTGLRYKFKLY